MQNQDSHSQIPYFPSHHNLPNAPIFSAVRLKPSFQKPISNVAVIINQSHQHRAQTELERERGEREMKGTAMAANGTSLSSSVLGGGGGRSESDKEKTKMRERQRRAITGKIFHGLRKHGGYRLSPRADINEVLRHLASEAGWIVEPDGTTFRSNVGNCCPMCGAARSRASAPPTPTSSVVFAGGGGCGGGGGESSTTASPRRFAVGDPAIAAPSSTLCNVSSSGMSSVDGDIPMAALYSMYGGFSGGLQQYSSAVFHGEGASPAAFQQHQLQEARASNQNTPVGSPMHHA